MCQIQVIAEPEVSVFVDYEVSPVPSQCVAELAAYLQKAVWGQERRADEDIRVTNLYGTSSGEQNLVRYQFGDLQEAEMRMDEIGELIQQALEAWGQTTNCLED